MITRAVQLHTYAARLYFSHIKLFFKRSTRNSHLYFSYIDRIKKRSTFGPFLCPFVLLSHGVELKKKYYFRWYSRLYFSKSVNAFYRSTNNSQNPIHGPWIGPSGQFKSTLPVQSPEKVPSATKSAFIVEISACLVCLWFSGFLELCHDKEIQNNY